ncbi:MAG: SagB/ThcOx family dehydrogenase [Desulfomonilaceae bacterium]
MTMSAAEYHRATSYDRRKMSGHALDWSNQPSVFKSYVGQPLISLPDEQSFSPATLWDVLGQDAALGCRAEIDLACLARVLVLAHTITAKARYGGMDFFYRSVASAGALYPFELYAAVLDVAGLAPGVYHHQPATRSLALLRRGYSGRELSQLAPDVGPATAKAVFFISSIFFRSSWKYRERAYRYHLLDSGHLLENLILALRFEGLSYRVAFDFDDMALNQFLGFDQEREGCLAVAAATSEGPPSRVDTETPLDSPGPQLPVCSRVAPRETHYAAIKTIHEASFRANRPDAQPDALKALGLRPHSWQPLPRPCQPLEPMSLPEALIKRRSMRNFVKTTLSRDHLSLLLDAVCYDAMSHEGQASNPDAVAVGFLAGNVEHLEPGFYLLDRRSRSFGLVQSGFFAPLMAHICLDQEWLANCALHFLFLANLAAIETAYGPRGYRYAMLQAGSLGQRLYLAATSIRLGCCGIGAFYDDEAAQLLGLADESRLLYLAAVGPVRKWVEPTKNG